MQNHTEGFLPPSDAAIPHPAFAKAENLKAVLKEVSADTREIVLLLSQIHNNTDDERTEAQRAAILVALEALKLSPTTALLKYVPLWSATEAFRKACHSEISLNKILLLLRADPQVSFPLMPVAHRVSYRRLEEIVSNKVHTAVDEVDPLVINKVKRSLSSKSFWKRLSKRPELRSRFVELLQQLESIVDQFE